MDTQSNCLFITYVEKEGPFLKVWGQIDKNTSLYIEQVLHSFTNQFDNGLCIPHPESLQIGILCCAKYKDNKYYRARVTSLDFLQNRYIEVNFVDYGHKDVVPISNIRSLEGFETSFISIQPQATSFLLAEAVCPRGEWNDAYLDEISKEIRYTEVNFSIIAQVTKHYLVRLFVGVNDLAIILISRGLMRHTSLTTQEAVLLSMMPRTTPQQQAQPAAQQNIATYKAFTLEPGSQYEVYVSYVTDGPCNFSVQLKQSEEVLGKLMKEINSMTLTPIEGIPIPGTVCLARCMEDGHICRAVVTNEVDGQFKVFYVDFGNFEQVALEALYEIPFKFVIPKVMAIRFALAGVEKSTVTLEMQCAFKQFVDNRLIHMKVMPMTTRTSLPRCELWDPETQISALDIVNQAASAGYPDHVSLNRGSSQAIKVSYVFSCNRFYVQLKSRQDDLLRLMLDIQVLSRDAEPITNNMVKVGMPCYALFEADQQWYRSQIVEVLAGGKARVQYVDYGNEEEVSTSLLKTIEGKQLTILRPQAIECCLNGYQNMEPDLERDNLLEELILEQDFVMRVVEKQGKKALVELIDLSNYNVASLLLDKIAITRSQVSPMLVQAGNKIEHRKSFSHQNSAREQPYKQDQRKPERDQRQWVDSSHDNSSWRQDGRGHRNRSSIETNDNNENNSWRQNNKGFNKNYERNRRDNDLNDSTDSERHSTKGYGKNDRNRNDFNSRNADGGSFKQNNRNFNKNQDRFNKDNNRNNEWTSGEDAANTKEKDDWVTTDSQNTKATDEWGSPSEGDTRQFNKRNRDNWGGEKDGGKRNFTPRNRDEGDHKRFNNRDNWSNKENDKQTFNKESNDWGHKNESNSWDNKDDGKGRSNFQVKENDNWGTSENKYQKDSWNNKEERRGRPNFQGKESDSWGNTDNKPETDSWNNKADRRGRENFRSKDKEDWGSAGGKQEKDSWSNREDRKGRENFRYKNRSDEGNNEWNTESTNRGGFKKKPDFKRETSELSSSGSEKSFRKDFKGNFRDKNKPNFNKKFDKSPKGGFGGESGDGAWNTSASPPAEVPNPAPSTAKFGVLNVDNTESNVIISWFHNPTFFYCQIENTQDEFKRMMGEIQVAYKGRPPSTAVVGAPVIGLFPEDGVLYRAEVLEIIGSQFKVYYVDFGNVSVINKVWPIEMRFMELPAQAICCKLSGVEPLDESWPGAGTFGSYFNKNQFLCQFIAKEDDRVSVKLEAGNEDIASLLLRDGLAKSVLSSDPPELPLLIGQQFRAMLLSINSLADFSMSLPSGVLINCSIFNLAQSTETWEDNLKEKLEKILIVYVDDLKEDRLEVTLYDENGAKIKLIDRDEEAYESVELLCPYLILYSVLSGEITHVNETTVFIQPSDCAQSVEYLLNTSYEYYEKMPLESPIIPVEGYVYAVRGSDTNWYRGRVTKVEDSQVTVNYLDYGNSEEVEATALRDLTIEFMEIPISCVSVTIPNATEDLIGKLVTVNLTFTENGLEGIIQEDQAAVVIVAEPELTPVEPQTTEVEQPIQQRSGQYGTLVTLSHIDSPSDFYLQLADSIKTIEDLQATLQEQVPEMVDMENPVVGVLCAAPYSLDQQWYRAQVLDADADITTVRFVDYGNTDVLDNHTTRVKTLPQSLLAIEVHATRCRLKIKPLDEEWTSTASERFEELCNTDALTAQFISQDEKTNYVELYSNGTNVREILIQENLALADEIATETSSVGFVSHLNSPSEFWIQLENCVEELEWIAEQLAAAESFSELEDLAPGALCAALFPDDQMWYRARILSNTVAGIEVVFVDYGNSCMSCSLRELPEELVMLPPLAQKCSLQKPENLTNWGPEMVRKFSEIAADGQTTFNVKKLSTGETASVELLLDGVDVTTLLLPTTEDVHVKSFENLDELVLIKNDEVLQTKYKLESLPDVAWKEESVQKFEEINKNGETVFQAEFVSDDTVRLYLGLNDIRPDLNGVKMATPTSSPLKSRSEVTKHSDVSETGDVHDIKNMVEGFVDSIIDHEENIQFVQNLVKDLADKAVDQSAEQSLTGHDRIKNLVENFVDLVIEQQENKEFLGSVVANVVDNVTSEHIALADTAMIDHNVMVKQLVEGLVESVINNQQNSNFVQTLVSDVVDSILTNQNSTKEILIYHESGTNHDRSTNSIVYSILTDIIEQITHQCGDSTEEFTVNSASDHVEMQNNQINASSESPITNINECGTDFDTVATLVSDIAREAVNRVGALADTEPLGDREQCNTRNDIETIIDDIVQRSVNEIDTRDEDLLDVRQPDTNVSYIHSMPCTNPSINGNGLVDSEINIRQNNSEDVPLIIEASNLETLKKNDLDDVHNNVSSVDEKIPSGDNELKADTQKMGSDFEVGSRDVPSTIPEVSKLPKVHVNEQSDINNGSRKICDADANTGTLDSKPDISMNVKEFGPTESEAITSTELKNSQDKGNSARVEIASTTVTGQGTASELGSDSKVDSKDKGEEIENNAVSGINEESETSHDNPSVD